MAVRSTYGPINDYQLPLTPPGGGHNQGGVTESGGRTGVQVGVDRGVQVGVQKCPSGVNFRVQPAIWGPSWGRSGVQVGVQPVHGGRIPGLSVQIWGPDLPGWGQL